MKSKYADIAAKIILTVVIVILVGLLVAWMVGLFKDKKQDLNSAMDKTNTVINSLADFDYLAYDGAVISGESLVEIISEFKNRGEQVAICVQTLDGADTDYIYNYTSNNLGSPSSAAVPTSKTSSGYITPTGNFKGKVLKNSNEEIVCLRFKQQK